MNHINQDFYHRERLADQNVSDMDRLISGYIKAIGESGYGDILRFDTRGEVKFHLGCERQSGISWYPFTENAAILEVGGEFGAMTGVLCDRAERVVVSEPSLFRASAIRDRYAGRENLEVYAGRAQEIEFPLPV